MNREELAWAAGFFDGEGCTSARFSSSRSRNPSWQVVVVVGQTGREVLDRFRAAVLGVGKVYGPYRKHHSGADYFQYYASGHRHAQAVIAMLWPWLSSPKRDQARRVFFKSRPFLRPRSGSQNECPQGHPYDESNTTYRTKNGSRQCRTCNRNRLRQLKRRRGLAHALLIAV